MDTLQFHVYISQRHTQENIETLPEFFFDPRSLEKGKKSYCSGTVNRASCCCAGNHDKKRYIFVCPPYSAFVQRRRAIWEKFLFKKPPLSLLRPKKEEGRVKSLSVSWRKGKGGRESVRPGEKREGKRREWRISKMDFSEDYRELLKQKGRGISFCVSLCLLLFLRWWHPSPGRRGGGSPLGWRRATFSFLSQVIQHVGKEEEEEATTTCVNFFSLDGMLLRFSSLQFLFRRQSQGPSTQDRNFFFLFFHSFKRKNSQRVLVDVKLRSGRFVRGPSRRKQRNFSLLKGDSFVFEGECGGGLMAICFSFYFFEHQFWCTLKNLWNFET